MLAWIMQDWWHGSSAIDSHLHDIMYEMVAIAKPIPLKGGVERLSNIGPTIGDKCWGVHMQIE